jgi:hypothetical protein
VRGRCSGLPADVISIEMPCVERIPTKREPMILFSQGRDARPVSAGRVFMMYKRVQKPGASIVSHAILPGILNLLFEEVLPAPYQEVTHCRFASCCSSAVVSVFGGSFRRYYHCEVGTKEVDKPLVILSRRRHIVLNERHV